MSKCPPSTLDTTERGVTRSIWDVKIGDYIWHEGAYRRVTGVNGRTIRLGRLTLRSVHSSTVEAAP